MLSRSDKDNVELVIHVLKKKDGNDSYRAKSIQKLLDEYDKLKRKTPSTVGGLGLAPEEHLG